MLTLLSRAYLQGFKDLSVEARYKTWTNVNVNPIKQSIFA
jgi:hypothetical protein